MHINKHTCSKCNKVFNAEKLLIKHLNKKIPCDRKIECYKCLKIFSDMGNLNRHLRRKTPCDPILGNTQEPIKNSRTCHFCYREFTLKHNLHRHFRTCKIRNGNMPILFKKIEEDAERIEKLENKTKQFEKIINNQNITNQNNNNNILQFNFGSFLEKSQGLNLVNFGDVKTGELIQNIIDGEEDNIRKLIQKPSQGIAKEWGERVKNIIQLIFRNPQHPQMQNIFTTGAKEHLVNWNDAEPIRAFLWNKNKWNGAEWIKVREYLIRQVHEYLPSFRRDTLEVKSKIRKAWDFPGRDPLARSKPKLINEFFQEYEDSRDDTEFLWVFIAIALDKEGLLDMNEINRLLAED